MKRKQALISAAEIALMTAVISVCAWITVPMAVPFTLQTFGVFLTLEMLGGASGTVAILAYILLGAVGVPVFSGFAGGVSVLLGPTGGYIIGFLACGLIYLFTEKIRKNTIIDIVVLIIGLFACYAFGTVWFAKVMEMRDSAMGIGTILVKCVLPFILPDAVKLTFALIIAKRVKKVLPKVR
jgi:biotin transport system substrate-specific component